jgi:hypothetical protein
MTSTVALLTEARSAVARAVAAQAAGAQNEDDLLASIASSADLARELDLLTARLAADAAARSHHSLGSRGLAARHGHLNAEGLVRSLTRSSYFDAARRVRVGTALIGPDGPLNAVTEAVVEGNLGIEGADRILRTLSPIVNEVNPVELAASAEQLAVDATTLNADELAERARGVRDGLDRIGVTDRHAFLRSKRSLRKGPVIDGLRKVNLVLDPESDVLLLGAIDAAMSPRLSGPRFASDAEEQREKAMLEDPRTNEQMALDTLVDLVTVGVGADPGIILGANKPAVRITMTLDDLHRGLDERGGEAGRLDPDSGELNDLGAAWMEGTPEPMTAATARRYLCDVGALPVILSGASQPLDVGRTKRFHTQPQRIAIAIRDGQCMAPGCDRPPSWCEVHHPNLYSKGGVTSVDNGILLCRRHHLLLHNLGGRIERLDSGQFVMIPPATQDPSRTAIPLRSKTPPWL